MEGTVTVLRVPEGSPVGVCELVGRTSWTHTARMGGGWNSLGTVSTGGRLYQRCLNLQNEQFNNLYS
jgi:hypothetical protein